MMQREGARSLLIQRQYQSQRRAYSRILTVMLVLLLMGFLTVRDYGVSWDEGTEISTVKYNYELITTGRPIPKDLAYYGIVFNGAAELLFQTQQWLTGQGFAVTDQQLEEGDRAIPQAIYQRIGIKHSLTFLVALGSYGGVIALVAILTGIQNAWLGGVVLALMPRFWAQGFYNPKDIPFATGFTLATTLGTLLLGRYAKPSESRRPLWLWALGYGAFLGLVCGTRLGGWVIGGFLVIAHFLSQGVGPLGRQPVKLLGFYGAIGIAWAGVTTAVYPSSWSNPVNWFISANRYFANHTWPGLVFFQGESLRAADVPWFYIPLWLLRTVPPIWLVAALVGILFILKNYPYLTPRQQAGVILVSCQIVGLPLIAIATQAPVYNGMRQFLFVLPGIAVLASCGLLWGYQQIVGSWRRFFALSAIAILMSPIVLDMITLHPHQYAYFNRVSGGLKAAYQRDEIDYWGLSLREAMNWLNETAPAEASVAIGGPFYIGAMFAREDLQLLDLDADLDYGNKGQPDYYVSMIYIDLADVFPQCPVVHQVERQGVPLSLVKRCSS